ncbi:Retrovirus-related Pol polyprotein from transposon 17.6 [Dictyocoela muelleri]|nr:Retrovirus-related Pol polyprotein from transposon 17.6 [Dictyocoela muelleri]
MLPIYFAIKSRKISEKTKKAIDEVKYEINKAMPLKLPDLDKPFTIYTDASNFALGAVLTLKYDNKDIPIFFHSQKLLPSEINYTTTEKECQSIIKAVKKWKHYLCNKFYIKTDHQALIWLLKNKDNLQRLARWNMFLQNFSFEITYLKGSKNILGDTLSRCVFSVIEEKN